MKIYGLFGSSCVLGAVICFSCGVASLSLVTRSIAFRRAVPGSIHYKLIIARGGEQEDNRGGRAIGRRSRLRLIIRNMRPLCRGLNPPKDSLINKRDGK
jgi:hypothetical protein